MSRETEIKEIYGKGLFDMTIEELIDNHLVEDWVRAVDENAEEVDE